MVSKSCLTEVNHLRDTYRKDLPQYSLPVEPRTSTKRKLTGATQHDQPKAKKGKTNLSSQKKEEMCVVQIGR